MKSSKRAFPVVIVGLLLSVHGSAAQAPSAVHLTEAVRGCLSAVSVFTNEAIASNPQWKTSPDAQKAAASHILHTFFDGSMNYPQCLAYMLEPSLPESVKRTEYKLAFAEFRKAGQNITQAGSGSSASGTTNLVSKNLNSSVLSLASEYGGLTQSTSGQTTTLSGTLAGIPLQLESRSGVPLFAECTSTAGRGCIGSKTLENLDRISWGVGVGTGGGSAGSGTAGTASGGAQPVTLSSASSSSAFSLNQVTAKFAALRQMPTVADLATAAAKLNATAFMQAGEKLKIALAGISDSAAAQQDLDDAAAAFLDGCVRDPSTPGTSAPASCSCTPQSWATAAQAYLRAANNAHVDYQAAVVAFLQALGQFTAQEDLAYASAIKPTVSAEYDLNTPANQLSDSVFRLIVSWMPVKQPLAKDGAGGPSSSKSHAASSSSPSDKANASDKTGPPGSWTFTFNAAASIYNSQPSSSIPSARRLRDIQIAGEADYKLPRSLPVLGAPSFCGAFYYQDQTSAAILKVPVSGLPITGLNSTTNQVFTRTGPIDIGQFKISFGSTSSGFRVPLAFTVANRTELLQGMDVKGQIGISYDFDSLLSK